MNLPFFIAKRYFRSRHKKNFIQVISMISMIVVAIGTIALIVSLSVFNGLEGLLRGMYGSFDPDLILRPISGKSITLDSALLRSIQKLDGVKAITPVIEDNVLLKYKDAQRVVKIKGVSPEYNSFSGLNELITSGYGNLLRDSIPMAIVGRGIQYSLSINTRDLLNSLQVFYPNEIRPGVVNPGKMYKIQTIEAAGVFAFEKYYDDSYVFVPITFAQSLFSYNDRVNYYEVFLNDPGLFDMPDFENNVNSELEIVYGDQIHADLYKIIKVEKLFVFLILVAIIAIASINIYFALTMLVIEKKEDISMLKAQGATDKTIMKIFLFEGCIIAFTGAIAGLIVGLGITIVQEKFGIVGMGMTSSVVSSYPVKIIWSDIALVVIAILIITFLASVQPALKASNSFSVKEFTLKR